MLLIEKNFVASGVKFFHSFLEAEKKLKSPKSAILVLLMTSPGALQRVLRSRRMISYPPMGARSAFSQLILSFLRARLG
jgi:hypothetical protein